jgi:hypothetical protein
LWNCVKKKGKKKKGKKKEKEKGPPGVAVMSG